MLLINEKKKLSQKIAELKKSGRKINFIPTMGNLHKGHISLIRAAKKKNFISLVSIYVNPHQFDDKKDFLRYPRTLSIDKCLLIRENIDLLFAPDNNFLNKKLYPPPLGKIASRLCGVDRPGHFKGVAKVIINFLDIIKPNYIYLGEKDFQQIMVIKKIIKVCNFKTDVIVVPTIRDTKEVAISSRNQFLRNKKNELMRIPDTLNKIRIKISEGNFSISSIEDFKKNLLENDINKVNYLEILKEDNLSKIGKNFCDCRIFISVNIDGIKLIDNKRLDSRIKLVGEKIVVEN
ncbi:MAG: pantoate--beta-alanine ligase [Alphaproteobacteria bacterium]